MSVQALSWVLEHSDTKGAKRLVLISVANHADDSGHAWPSHQTIAREAGITPAHAKRTLSDLVQEGHLERKVNGAPDERIPRDRRPNLYRLCGFARGASVAPPGIDRGASETSPAGGTSTHARGAQRRATGGLSDAPKPSREPSVEPSVKETLALHLVTETHDPQPDPVVSVFDAWREAVGKTGRTTLSADRRKLIASRLKDYPVADLVDAVRGLGASGWHVENGHTDLTNALSKADRIERFRDLHRNPVKPRRPAHQNLIEDRTYSGPVAL